MTNESAVFAVTSLQFEELIEKKKLVFVDFWAPWCGPCKQFAPVYEEVAESNPSIIFASVNVQEDPELAEMFNIQSIPHLMVFKEGIAIYSEAGSMPKSVLLELVQQAITVDVSEIREQLNQEDE